VGFGRLSTSVRIHRWKRTDSWHTMKHCQTISFVFSQFNLVDCEINLVFNYLNSFQICCSNKNFFKQKIFCMILTVERKARRHKTHSTFRHTESLHSYIDLNSIQLFLIKSAIDVYFLYSSSEWIWFAFCMMKCFLFLMCFFCFFKNCLIVKRFNFLFDLSKRSSTFDLTWSECNRSPFEMIDSIDCDSLLSTFRNDLWRFLVNFLNNLRRFWFLYQS
jgi:hypothetical protein